MGNVGFQGFGGGTGGGGSGVDISLPLDAVATFTAGSEARAVLRSTILSHTFDVGVILINDFIADRIREQESSTIIVENIRLHLATVQFETFSIVRRLANFSGDVIHSYDAITPARSHAGFANGFFPAQTIDLALLNSNAAGQTALNEKSFVLQYVVSSNPSGTNIIHIDPHYDDTSVIFNTGSGATAVADGVARADAAEAKTTAEAAELKAQQAIDNTLGTGTAQNQLISKRYDLTINPGNAVSATHNFARAADGSKLTHTLTILNEAVGNIPDIVGHANNGGTFRADYHGAFTLELLPGYSDTDGDAIVELDVKVTRQVWQDSVHVPAFDRVVRISNARRNTGAFFSLFVF